MSDKPMVQAKLRKIRLIVGRASTVCAECLDQWETSEAEHHQPGCPCDKANIIITRAMLDTLYDVALHSTHPDAGCMMDEIMIALKEEGGA